MSHRRKITTSLTTLALFGLSLACDSHASPREVPSRTYKYVQPCIAEIGKHANYEDASRVVHWVTKFDHRNLVETELRISTAVYLRGDKEVTREYLTSCVTASLGELVEFQFAESGAAQDASGRGNADAST